MFSSISKWASPPSFISRGRLHSSARQLTVRVDRSAQYGKELRETRSYVGKDVGLGEITENSYLRPMES